MRRFSAFVAAVLTAASSAFAHFPFIIVDPSGATAKLVMSETLDPDPSVSIDLLSSVTLFLRAADGTQTPLTMTKAEQWMTLALPGEGTRVVYGAADLGVMQRGGSKAHHLIYYPKTIVGDAFSPATTLGDRPVELVPVRVADGFDLRILIAGKPAGNQEIRVIDPKGLEEDYKADADGLIGPFTEPGRYGAWARHWVDQTGTHENKSYEQVRHYATLAFDFAGSPASPAAAANAATDASTASPAHPQAPVRSFAKLPYAAASFGAVAVDGWLYFFGGHTATRHEYSTASVSRRFLRLNLTDPSDWQELPNAEVAVQGMNLAAYKGKVIRVGGMEPRNSPGEKSDSYSLDSGSIFDPAANRWTALPVLPFPRSSHDVVVVGDSLYAIGGWWMKGRDTDPEFFDTMEVLDLAAQNPTWKSVPQPFSRRALIVTPLNDRIFVLGGFDAEDEPHLDVNIYDTKARVWSKGPSIPGSERDGFAPAACSLDGTIYLSVGSGKLYRLSEDEQSWIQVAGTTPRLAHRMVSNGKEVLIIGGASEARMVDHIEAVQVTE